MSFKFHNSTNVPSRASHINAPNSPNTTQSISASTNTNSATPSSPPSTALTNTASPISQVSARPNTKREPAPSPLPPDPNDPWNWDPEQLKSTIANGGTSSMFSELSIITEWLSGGHITGRDFLCDVDGEMYIRDSISNGEDIAILLMLQDSLRDASPRYSEWMTDPGAVALENSSAAQDFPAAQNTPRSRDNASAQNMPPSQNNPWPQGFATEQDASARPASPTQPPRKKRKPFSRSSFAFAAFAVKDEEESRSRARKSPHRPARQYCLCGTAIFNGDMVWCAGPLCATKIFHADCLGDAGVEVRGGWLCPECARSATCKGKGREVAGSARSSGSDGVKGEVEEEVLLSKTAARCFIRRKPRAAVSQEAASTPSSASRLSKPASFAPGPRSAPRSAWRFRGGEVE